jgi:hypothetical protein
MKISRYERMCGGQELRAWTFEVCAAILLLSWPVYGYAQTAVATVAAGRWSHGENGWGLSVLE